MKGHGNILLVGVTHFGDINFKRCTEKRKCVEIIVRTSLTFMELALILISRTPCYWSGWEPDYQVHHRFLPSSGL